MKRFTHKSHKLVTMEFNSPSPQLIKIKFPFGVLAVFRIEEKVLAVLKPSKELLLLIRNRLASGLVNTRPRPRDV